MPDMTFSLTDPYMDCEGHVEDRRLSKAIANLGEHCSYVKVLGSYPDSE
jgi:prephenate dehydratase